MEEAINLKYSNTIQFCPRQSDSLRAVAGSLAPAIACLDPFPHLNALSASRLTLHLVGLALTRSPAPILDDVFSVPWPKLVEALFGADPPRGLRAILAACPTTMFEPEYYVRLDRLLAQPLACVWLSGLDEVSTLHLQIASNLPEELIRPRLMCWLKTPADAELVALLMDAANALPRLGRKRLIESLTEKRSARAFWAELSAGLVSVLGGLPAPPALEDHPRLYVVHEAGDFIKAWRAFQNCMLHYLDDVLLGEFGFLVWSGDGDRVLIGVTPRFGAAGEVVEMKRPRNEALSAPLRTAVEADLTALGYVFAEARLETREHARDFAREVCQLNGHAPQMGQNADLMHAWLGVLTRREGQ